MKHIELMIKHSPLRRPRKMQRYIYPRQYERQYESILKGPIKTLQVTVAQSLFPRLPELARQNEKHRADAWHDDLEQIMAQLGIQWGRTFTKEELKQLALMTGRTLSFWNKQQLGKTISKALDLPTYFSDEGLSAVLDSWAYENARLITDAGETMLSQIEGIVSRGIQSGTLWEDIQAEIVGTGIEPGRFGTAESRAAFIARDQIGKLNSDLSELRQTNLGISEYIWRTAMDEHVRPEHAAREGETFSWDDPPEGGHPGEDYGCRCYPEPKLPSDDADE